MSHNPSIQYGLFVVSFFFQAEDGIRDLTVTGVQTCALPISPSGRAPSVARPRAPDRDTGAAIRGRDVPPDDRDSPRRPRGARGASAPDHGAPPGGLGDEFELPHGAPAPLARGWEEDRKSTRL